MLSYVNACVKSYCPPDYHEKFFAKIFECVVYTLEKCNVKTQIIELKKLLPAMVFTNEHA